MVLSLRTIGAHHSHHVCWASARWQGVERKVCYGLSLLWEKRYINEKRLFKNSHEKRFFDAIRKSSFSFYTSVLSQQRKFLKTKFPVTSVIRIWFLTRWYIVCLLEVLKVTANRKQKYYGIIVAYFIIREVRIIPFSL